MGRKAQKNDSLPGSLDMLILRTVSRRDLHGYGIVQFIQQSSDNELLVEEGSLYPALQRLELNGHRPAPLRGPSEMFRIVDVQTMLCQNFHKTLPGIDSCCTDVNRSPSLTLGA